ncbi:MAG TPA: hypothetical protein VGO50_07830 [Pyrinomonadaceae bacterium]|jgi:5-methylcytosine-specific restriction protein A|nr:hypothetical protein [Pyrinomonadaceae bacterium]
MATFLLTWNPYKWTWHDLGKDSEKVREGQEIQRRWSCGVTKKIKNGDRIFLAKLGDDTRGIIASGYVNQPPYYDAHWDIEKRGQEGLYVGIIFDTLLNPETDLYLSIKDLSYPPLSNFNWTPQSSGTEIPAEIAEELELFWEEFAGSQIFIPEEIEDGEAARLFEGSKKQIQVNAYERNKAARNECIKYYGAKCFVCDFDFGKVYGEIGKGFIHVHHLKPLWEINEKYEIDPLEDLRPVCPNCHAIIHRHKEVLLIEDIKSLIDDNKK